MEELKLIDRIIKLEQRVKKIERAITVLLNGGF